MSERNWLKAYDDSMKTDKQKREEREKKNEPIVPVYKKDRTDVRTEEQKAAAAEHKRTGKLPEFKPVYKKEEEQFKDYGTGQKTEEDYRKLKELLEGKIKPQGLK